MKVLALVDGEHYPPVTRWGIQAARSMGHEVVGALFLGGTEKVSGGGAGSRRSLPRAGLPVRPSGMGAAAPGSHARRHRDRQANGKDGDRGGGGPGRRRRGDAPGDRGHGPRWPPRAAGRGGRDRHRGVAPRAGAARPARRVGLPRGRAVHWGPDRGGQAERRGPGRGAVRHERPRGGGRGRRPGSRGGHPGGQRGEHPAGPVGRGRAGGAGRGPGGVRAGLSGAVSDIAIGPVRRYNVFRPEFRVGETLRSQIPRPAAQRGCPVRRDGLPTGAAPRCAGKGRVLHHNRSRAGGCKAGRPSGIRARMPGRRPQHPPGGPAGPGGGHGRLGPLRGVADRTEGGGGRRGLRTGRGPRGRGGLRGQPGGHRVGGAGPGRPAPGDAGSSREQARGTKGCGRPGRPLKNERGMKNDQRNTHIVISDRDHGLPYSKGLMASRVMVTGLAPYRAYQVAERIEDVLLDRSVPSVTSQELNELTTSVLEEVAGERYAKNFLRWQEVERLDIPLVLLIGGATGVGKSTIATQLAARLGIVRVVATDAIREVMRSMFTKELMPTLHTSSFNADTALREPPPRAADRVIVGFREQAAAVSVGLHALLERAAVERTSLILEGAHVVPGFVDIEEYADRCLAVECVISVDDEATHRLHFSVRSAELPGRPVERYERGFDKIRKLQKYIKSQALAHGVPVIPNYSLDQTIAAVVDLIVERATERVGTASGDAAAAAGPPGSPGAEPATVAMIEGRA